MYKDLLKHNRFGSFEEVLFVLENSFLSSTHRIDDIREFCLNSTKFMRIYFTGIVDLLEFMSFVEVNEDKVYITLDGRNFVTKETKYEESKLAFASAFFKSLKNSEKLAGFFDFLNIKYDYPTYLYSIRRSDFPLRYCSIINLLIELGVFLSEKSNSNMLTVTKESIDYFHEYFSDRKHNKTLEQLKDSQLLIEQYGREAEEFALSYEIDRLNNHPRKKDIKIISNMDVSAGFDIISFKDERSENLDLFIEVKSCAGKQHFYWSANEIEVAKIKAESYCIYLIDRDCMKKDGYKPNIIVDPYKEIYSSSLWSKKSTSWYFSKI